MKIKWLWMAPCLMNLRMDLLKEMDKTSNKDIKKQRFKPLERRYEFMDQEKYGHGTSWELDVGSHIWCHYSF